MCNKDCFHCQFADCISDDKDYTDIEEVDKTLQAYIEWQRNIYKLKDRQVKYEKTDKAKERRKKYEQTDKAKDRMYKYNHSKKGIARRKRQNKKRRKLTPAQIYSREYNKKYYLRKKLEKAKAEMEIWVDG